MRDASHNGEENSSKGPEGPLVAIVTPVYNGGKYLEQTMRSVQAQTYTNIVHVILNNASTDNSAEIINSFLDKRIKVLVYNNPQTIPLADNWNKAFSYVPEDAVYAKLLCADDLVRSDCIERYVNLAESDPEIQIVMCHDIFADLVRRVRLPTHTQVHDGKKVAKQILGGKNGYLAYHHFFIRMQDSYRGESFFGKHWSPDPHAVVRSTIRGKFGYIPEPLVYDRYHLDSVTGKELKSKGVQLQLVGMYLLKEFGEQVYGTGAQGRREFMRAKKSYCELMCRHIVRWRFTGEAERAEVLRRTLTENGFTLSAWRYIVAVCWWPVVSVLWRINDSNVGPHIDEPTFVSFGAKGQEPIKTVA